MRGPIPPTWCWLRLTESISASGTPTINSWWWRRWTRSRTRPGAPCFTLTIFPILRRPCTIASQCVYSADTKVSSREARRWSPASLKRLRPRLPVPHRNSGDGFFRFAAGQLLLRNLPSGSSCRSLVPVNGQQTPGLLVVLNEPWYDWAGLAEQFEVQVASVTDPLGNSYLQAGPDPVVSNPVQAPGTPAPITLEANPTAIGPIGFTSDTNTNAPLFAITSFIVPAPRQQDADGTLTPIELSWWFLQAAVQQNPQSRRHRLLRPGSEQRVDCANAGATLTGGQFMECDRKWQCGAG